MSLKANAPGEQCINAGLLAFLNEILRFGTTRCYHPPCLKVNCRALISTSGEPFDRFALFIGVCDEINALQRLTIESPKFIENHLCAR